MNAKYSYSAACGGQHGKGEGSACCVGCGYRRRHTRRHSSSEEFSKLGYSAMRMIPKPNHTVSGSSRPDLTKIALLGTGGLLAVECLSLKCGPGGELPCVVYFTYCSTLGCFRTQTPHGPRASQQGVQLPRHAPSVSDAKKRCMTEPRTPHSSSSSGLESSSRHRK